jgi:hypothetical protein
MRALLSSCASWAFAQTRVCHCKACGCDQTSRSCLSSVGVGGALVRLRVLNTGLLARVNIAFCMLAFVIGVSLAVWCGVRRAEEARTVGLTAFATEFDGLRRAECRGLQLLACTMRVFAVCERVIIGVQTAEGLGRLVREALGARAPRAPEDRQEDWKTGRQ